VGDGGVTGLRVAVAQILSTADPAVNLAMIADRVREAATAGVALVLFPEAAMCRFGEPLRPVAEPVDGPWASALHAVADREQIVVAAGMFTPAGGGRVHNTLRAVGPGVDAAYDKIHLYDAFGFQESATVAGGRELVLIEVAGARVGLTLCYDVRFPGLYTELADRGAQVICVAASWGAGPGKVEQWELLTRARALDTTTFVLAAAQADPSAVGEPVGEAPTGVGHSAVIGPRGEVLAALARKPGLLVVDLDLDEVERTRAVLPVLANRRR
jgi:predicted amidohydrolase